MKTPRIISTLLCVVLTASAANADGNDAMPDEPSVSDAGPTWVARSIDVEEGPLGMRLPDGARFAPRFQASSGTVAPGIVDLNRVDNVPTAVQVDVEQRRRRHHWHFR